MNSELFHFNTSFRLVYTDPANTVDAYVPEKWALESLDVLMSNAVAVHLIHRDFSNIIAQAGDVVNTRKPSTFIAKRKVDADDVTVQAAEATNIPVTLNQHIHVSFLIKDGEESKAFKSLVDEFIGPAMIAHAEFLDAIILGQVAQFIAYRGGLLGGLTSSNAKTYILATRRVMNDNKIPMAGRNMVLTTAAEAILLENELFISAEKVGDDGTALREASLGKKLGFNMFTCQNMNYVADPVDTTSGEIDRTGGFAVGETLLDVDGFTSSLVEGCFVTIEGEMKPHWLSVTTESTLSYTSTIELDSGLEVAVADNADVVVYDRVLIDEGSDYVAGWSKAVHIDNVDQTAPPQIGQLIAFGVGAARHVYTLIGITNTAGSDYDMILDRPLDTALTDGDAVFPGPKGSMNFAFRKNAVGLISRPLALPPSSTGVQATVTSFNGVGVRVVMQYQARQQGMLVTIDLLAGIAVLEGLAGAVMLG